MRKVPKPSRPASRNRISIWPTARTSPARPTSPQTTVAGSMGFSKKLDNSAATTPRSRAGSTMRMPPAMLRKMSWSNRVTPSFFSSTAVSRASRCGSAPMAVRRAVPRLERLTRACTSTRIGRVPSTLGSTTDPGTFTGRSARNRAEGLSTPTRPRSCISNTPISLVEPKRFLTVRRMRNTWPRSPSK